MDHHLETDSIPPRDRLEMPAPNAMTWTAGRLLADDSPAYGSSTFRGNSTSESAQPGTVYALSRRRVALDWRRACADDE